MLQTLYLKNFILIDETEIQFHEGFSVFVGETGAGKSLIVDALQIISGKKANAQYIKKGKDKAIIEALFHINDEIRFQLQQLDIECDDEIVVTKEITKDKTITKLNHRSITNLLLKKITRLLIDIHEQHDFKEFLDETTHLPLLDKFGNIDIENYTNHYHQYKALKLKKTQFLTEDQYDIEYLKFQLQEIENVNPQLNEDEQLKKIVDDYMLVEKQKQAIDQALQQIQLDGIRTLGNIYQDEALLNLYYELDEKLSFYLKSLHQSDEIRIDEIQERLFLIQNLKKKYGQSIEKIHAKKQVLQEQIYALEDKTYYLEQLDKEIEDVYKKCNTFAQQIKKQRQECALKLEQELVQQLHTLNFPYVEFKIQFTDVEINEFGMDHIQLLISFNKGEQIKPLLEIASGGELSRVLLALKSVFSKYQIIPTYIFDEIDSGVSGKVALSIGQKMHKIAQNKQVICITHLAAVAASGDAVYGVSKLYDETSTVSHVEKLNDEQLINQLALISSSHLSKSSIESANALLQLARSELKNA